MGEEQVAAPQSPESGVFATKLAHACQQLKVRLQALDDDGKIDMMEIGALLMDETRDLSALGAEFTTLSDAEKRDAILTAISRTYWKVNPNIPFLAEWVETPMEKMFLTVVLPRVYDTVVAHLHK
jgi:hypothetical protein